MSPLTIVKAMVDVRPAHRRRVLCDLSGVLAVQRSIAKEVGDKDEVKLLTQQMQTLKQQQDEVKSGVEGAGFDEHEHEMVWSARALAVLAQQTRGLVREELLSSKKAKRVADFVKISAATKGLASAVAAAARDADASEVEATAACVSQQLVEKQLKQQATSSMVAVSGARTDCVVSVEGESAPVESSPVQVLVSETRSFLRVVDTDASTVAGGKAKTTKLFQACDALREALRLCGIIISD
jgi:hypothetical protein